MSVRDFFRLLFGSAISLLILLLIVLLLLGMEQGLTIIVSLYESPFWLCVTVLMINFLALILSHFPYYFDLAIKDKDHTIEWTYAYRFLFLKYFYHNEYDRDIGRSKSALEGDPTCQVPSSDLRDKWLVSFLRRHIGVLCYNLFFAILVYVNASVFNISNNASCDNFSGMDMAYIIISGLLFLFLHLLIFMYFNKLNERIDKVLSDEEDPTDIKDTIRANLFLFNCLLIADVVLIIFLYFMALKSGWSRTNLFMLMGICHVNALLYIMFRLVRPWFIYYFKEDKSLNEYNHYPPKRIKDLYIKSWFSFLAGLSSTPNYLASMGAFGMLVVFGILTPGLFSDLWIMAVHPIPLLLSIIIFYYSAAVIILKYYIYLKSRLRRESNEKRFAYKLKVYAMYFLLGLVLTLMFLLSDTDNDLHTLPLVHKKESSSLDDYLENLSPSDTFFILGSYGGGLKANSWNMMLLEEIMDSNSDFFDKTLCMSGVSGGAIGIANHLALHYHHNQSGRELRDSIIVEIANSNMLSNDIFGLFIKDFWREFVPFPEIFYGYDRAHVSMKIYAQAISGSEPELDTAMSDYWLKVRSEIPYPAVILNTTPTSSNYGVACSIDDIPFYNSIDILDHGYLDGEKKSLSFFGAASTTNRFPFFSPAARIPRKGHFVDGGYFENSGLINALAFYEHIKDSLKSPDHTMKVVNVVNDKNLYILDVLKTYDLNLKNNEEQHEAEWSAVLKGLLTLERMPRYLRSRLEAESIEIISLHMPYVFNMGDLKALFKVHQFDGELESKLERIIFENRKTIIEVLYAYYEPGKKYDIDKWGIVTPPLGRLLSKPAVLYQKAMIQGHPYLEMQLDELK